MRMPRRLVIQAKADSLVPYDQWMSGAKKGMVMTRVCHASAGSSGCRSPGLLQRSLPEWGGRIFW